MNGKKHLSKQFNPGVEPLVAKYLEYRNRVELFEKKENKTKSEGDTIAFCRQKLDEVEAALFPPVHVVKKVLAAWQLLHRVGEEMILLMEKEELGGYGLRLHLEVKMSMLPDAQKEDWSIRIAESMKQTAEVDCNPEQVEHVRHLFKNIYRAINAIVDNSFWDLWANRLLALCYIVLLIGITGLFLWDMAQNTCLTPLKILMLGTIGGLLSGIVTGERETFPKGHFWMPTAYYILARPTLGALAALVTFWMIESQFLVRIDPPLSEDVSAFNCVSANKEKRPLLIESARLSGPTSETIPATKQRAEQGAPQEKGSVDLSVVTLTAKEGKQHYLYLLVLLFAGFAGDKLLKYIADRVTTKLMAKAEKTKEAK